MSGEGMDEGRLIVDGFAGPGGWAGSGPRQDAPGSIKITVEQAGILQSFPPSYPWQGSRSAQFRQVGDAVPPRLAAAVIGNLLGMDWRAAIDAEYEQEGAA